MSAQQTENSIDNNEKWLYRLGGLSGILFGIAYIAIIVLYVPLGARPSGAEAWLAYIGQNTTAWWGILSLSVLTDLLLVPIALALYVALKGLNKNAMLLAIAFVGLFVVLDLALTWTNYAVGIPLSGAYATAANDAERAAIITAAMYPSAVLESTLLFVYNSFTLALGIFIAGLVMLKGIFHKSTAYVGLLTGGLAMGSVASSFVASSVSTVAIVFASILTTVWFLLVGYKLFRLSQNKVKETNGEQQTSD